MGIMTTYTASSLQKEIGTVLGDVQTLGFVKIKSRSRPDMVLITQKELDSILLAQYELGKKEGGKNDQLTDTESK
ncbi:hypothetical protein VPAG_00051 [Vibrio phage douglas 12A4]|uniref:hypothetical protein n=1 Tax=Vibrio phage douglas 12A4 TaxID=573171 RepID=UPI0002C0BBF1|nr:hypothetical protein VPAG_00051 [Vibrio phage douglas 12A4]AGG58087.1 hypothetical protein VPAG_00051 [Vibrio phage douglas 12A4]